MIKQRYQYKKEANELMHGKYEKVIPSILIFGVIQFILSLISDQFNTKYEFNEETLTFILVQEGIPSIYTLLSILTFVLSALFTYAVAKLFIQIVNNEIPVTEDILSVGFKEQPLRTIIMSLIMAIYLFLWFFLFIIPAFVKYYAYSMSYYLLHRKPEFTSTDAISLSNQYTRGKKMDLFLLDLSYLGWYILGIFTFGILWLWIYPKHQTARTLMFTEIFEQENPSVKNISDLEEQEEDDPYKLDFE